MDSGLIAEPVTGPRFARTRWRCPGMTEDNSYAATASVFFFALERSARLRTTM
jgi:hypothetical protein